MASNAVAIRAQVEGSGEALTGELVAIEPRLPLKMSPLSNSAVSPVTLFAINSPSMLPLVPVNVASGARIDP